MIKIGFDNQKYQSLQSERILQRVEHFGGKLYMEFGGKLFDDYHASRVLPGFQPDSKIKMLLEEGRKYDQAIAIGPMIMMKFTMLTLRDTGIPLTVSLNTLMVDGTGMCGGCRVSVGGKMRFACVEGPEFDAYQVNFDEAMRRQGQYRTQEIEADHKCKIGRG